MKPQRNHRGHRGILTYKKLRKIFQGDQSYSLCPQWLRYLCVLYG